MKAKHFMAISAVCILVLSGSASAWAMSSSNYRLDWFVPLSGAGGGPASSTNYAGNFTIGQVAIGRSSSTNYQVGLGYWYGAAGPHYIYLPLILR